LVQVVRLVLLPQEALLVKTLYLVLLRLQAVAVVAQGVAHNTQAVLVVLVVVMRLTKAHPLALEQAVKVLMVVAVQVMALVAVVALVLLEFLPPLLLVVVELVLAQVLQAQEFFTLVAVAVVLAVLELLAVEMGQLVVFPQLRLLQTQEVVVVAV
jgi:hypothetical protein